MDPSVPCFRLDRCRQHRIDGNGQGPGLYSLSLILSRAEILWPCWCLLCATGGGCTATAATSNLRNAPLSVCTHVSKLAAISSAIAKLLELTHWLQSTMLAKKYMRECSRDSQDL